MEVLKIALQEQYGAAIDMLFNAIKACPDELWNQTSKEPPFWMVSHHTLFFLDFYLEGTKKGRKSFLPRFPDIDRKITIVDHKDGDKPPTKKQILGYLEDIKIKSKKRLDNITEEEMGSPSIFKWHGTNILSSLLYNLRHIMLHVGTLNNRLHRAGISQDLIEWVTFKKYK